MGRGVNAEPQDDVLVRVFGDGARGQPIETQALRSKREFVRGQTMLAEASPEAEGRRLSAYEALKTFGFPILQKAIDNGQAAIVPDRTEPAATLRRQREQLGFSVERFARIVGRKTIEISLAETPGKISPVRLLETLAPRLAIDERYLGFDAARSTDENLRVRFRTLSRADDASLKLSPTAVSQLAEAAWVIARQRSLASETVDPAHNIKTAFAPDPDYQYPVHAAGFRLAKLTRERLGLGLTDSILNLRRLIEDTLHIPLIETELGQMLAGATIANGPHRGIVVNTEGRNGNVWIRRMTLAHELGHLLWDPVQKLESLMVDRYDDIEGVAKRPRDPVEMRANAFAVAFLAPPLEVDRIVRDTRDVWNAIVQISERFGISPTASRAHVGNVCQLHVPSASGRVLPGPSDEWKGREDYTNDYFPLGSTPTSRRGRFTWTVIRAMDEGRISTDTAATLLNTKPDVLLEQKTHLLQLTSP
ncbi:ImmA/IrrE family metallo-endopeptidase [Caulobacter sp. S45]|uniref:ImmA/IrrE family metallo-endopeptidase n=1 Tax=Caulobacter sp. S45 TaxID=1641861 RepID=UPI0015762849|nr:ImmA/IrrE family metallo-endopeptidase [Caulobacter sp. S45]